MANYLSAEELKIEPWEHARLIEAIEVLPKLKRAPSCDVVNYDHIVSEGHLEGAGFNMEIASAEYDCGSVMCIGGLIYALENSNDKGEFNLQKASEYVTSKDGLSNDECSPSLGKLFFPDDIDSYHEITPERAVRGIKNFLKKGNPKWAKVVDD